MLLPHMPKDKKRDRYLIRLASVLVNELTPILKVKGVTANTALLGSYTEAAVQNLVRRIVHPMHVSTGAVVDYPVTVPLRQIDLIVWAPYPAPASFSVDNFGLVPKSSAFGVAEIKRSNYAGVDRKLEEFLVDARARRIVSDLLGPVADYGKLPALGVICVLKGRISVRLQR